MIDKKIKFGIISISSIIIISLIFFYYLSGEVSILNEQDNIEIFTESDSYNLEVKNTKTENPHANEILVECGIDGHCIVESLFKLADKEDKQTVLQTINDILSVYQQAEFYCHLPAHHVGEFLYGFTDDLSFAFTNSLDRYCGGAVIHGVLENYFQSEILLNNLEPKDLNISRICEKISEDPTSAVRVDCSHGLGHGLMKIYNNDVFSSVKRCDELSLQYEQRLCAEGIFMENVRANFKNYGGTFDKDDLLYPCNKVDEKYGGACYYYHVTYLMNEKGNVHEVFEECDKISSVNLLQRCYSGVGREISGAFIDNTSQVIPLCQLGKEDYRPYCYQGALVVIVDQLGFDESFQRCRDFPDSFKNHCYFDLGVWLTDDYKTPEERVQMCSKAENSEYFELCLSGTIWEPEI